MRVIAVGLIVISLIVLLFPGVLMLLLTPLVVAVNGLTAYLFIRDIGQNVSKVISSFCIFLCSIQLLGAPFLQYAYFSGDATLKLFNLLMQVDIEKYFSFALPGVMLFAGGMLLRDETEMDVQEFIFDRRVYKLCLLTGLFVYFIGGVLKLDFGTLNFLVHLLSLLLPASLVHAHLNALKLRRVLWKVLTWPLVFFSAWIIFGSIRSGMYSNFIFWGLVVSAVTFAEIKVNLYYRTILFCIGLFFALSVQMSKSSYRDLAWNQGNRSIENYFTTLSVGIQQTFDEENRGIVYFNSLIRLNQGWHLSHVIARSESESIMLKGRRVYESVLATVVPRFFWPSKPRAGGAMNIRDYTYINLQSGTSMNISFFGDFYLDFGRVGGVFALFFFGLVYRKYLNIFFNWARNDHLVTIAYPLLIVGIIQVETDLLMLMNHAFKASLLLWVLSKVFGTRKL